MADFKTLVNISSGLHNIVKEIEKNFAIKLKKEVIEGIFQDAEDDQVREKQYLIFEDKKHFNKL